MPQPAPLDELAEEANTRYLNGVAGAHPDLRRWASWKELNEDGRDVWRDVARGVIARAKAGSRN